MRLVISISWLVGISLSGWADEPVVQDRVFVAAHDQSEQRYVTITPARLDQTQPYDLLIALHGHGADRWQFVNDPRDECRAARDVAAKHRMVFLSPDYRARTSWMGPAAEADLVQIIETWKKSQAVRNIYLCGGSMGGTGALTFAARHPELINGVASMNGTANHLEYENFQDAIRESFGGDKRAIPEVYKQRSAEYWPERLTMPLGLTTGGKDTLVPPQSVQRLANVLTLLGRPVLLVHHEDGGHATNYADAVQILEHSLQGTAEASPATP